jgi:four helix bundle protein
LNYGEAQAAESRNDFIHKTSIVLKELRETKVSLRLFVDSIKKEEIEKLIACQNECDQLVAIFHKTVMSSKQKK